MAINPSTAVSVNRISRVIGYELKKGNFLETTPNLPQRIVVLAEANTANQANVDPTTPVEVIDENQAGQLYGYGSPIHQIMRILRPKQGGGVGSVPTFIYAQEEAGAAVAAERTITVTGTATETVTHNIVVNGRKSIDGASYAISVVKDDTATEVAEKIVDAINGIPASPITASNVAGVVTVVTKWAGETADELTVAVDNNSVAAGMSYAIASTVTGSGTASITDSLNDFGETWNTIVINSFNGSDFLDELEAFNGRPSNKSGRYQSNLWKPFIALFGNTDSTIAAIEAITDTSARKVELTNVLCPAPNSNGFSWEAAANVGALIGVQFQNSPNTDVSGKTYPDMPTATAIGDFTTYNGRDNLVKKGSSTVSLKNGAYEIQEIVTTYHPDGENPAQYRYTRILNIDWNAKYGEQLLVIENVIDKQIASDDATLSVQNFIKPKQWAAILSQYFEDLESRGLIVDAQFSIDSLQIATGSTNPDRLETFYKYKRSPYARVVSTTAEAGFAFNLTA